MSNVIIQSFETRLVDRVLSTILQNVSLFSIIVQSKFCTSFALTDMTFQSFILLYTPVLAYYFLKRFWFACRLLRGVQKGFKTWTICSSVFIHPHLKKLGRIYFCYGFDARPSFRILFSELFCYEWTYWKKYMVYSVVMSPYSSRSNFVPLGWFLVKLLLLNIEYLPFSGQCLL